MYVFIGLMPLCQLGLGLMWLCEVLKERISIFFFWFFILSQTATATLNELFITEWLHVSRECIKVNFSCMFIHLWAKMFIKSFPEIWFGLSTLLKSNCTLAAVDVENFDSAGVSVISQSRHSSTGSCASKSFGKNSLNTPAAGQN